MRPLATLLGLALVGLPILAAPIGAVAALGAAAGVLCAGGIVGRSPRMVTAGAGLGVIQYTLALWLRSAPPDFLTALALGIVLSLLLDVSDLAARFRGAALDAAVVRGQVRHWIGSAALAAAAGLALVVAVGRVTVALPSWAYPAAAGIGVLVAFAGAMWAVIRATASP